MPRAYQDVERRSLISFTLKTGDFVEARRRAAEISAQLEQDWREAKARGVSLCAQDAAERYRAAANVQRQTGFDAPLRFGVGLDGYTSPDGQTQYMRATPEHGQGITLDVTSLSPDAKAVLASYLDTWRMTEDAGETEWLLSLTQYDIWGQSIVDSIKLIEAQQVVNAVYGGFRELAQTSRPRR